MSLVLIKYLFFTALKMHGFKCFPELWPQALLQIPPQNQYLTSWFVVCLLKNCSNLYCSTGMTVLYN